MSRNRRNKRSLKKLTDVISLRTFFIILTILIVIILVCIGTILYKNEQNRKLLAKQREELDKKIEAIFTETMQNIADANENTPDNIIRISAVGDILCGDEMLQDAYDEETDTYSFNYMFKNITSFIEKSDITLGTMETNFTSNTYSGYGKRNSPKAFADAVKNSGINLVSITTNHSLDYRGTRVSRN